MTYPAQGLREIQDDFTRGTVIDVVSVPIGPKHTEVRFVKYHPWKSTPPTVHVGDADTKQVLWHCGEHNWSDVSLEAALVRYIAFKHLGPNQHKLVSGLFRALDIETLAQEA